MYECFGKGDMATLKTDVFAPDIAWSLPGHHRCPGKNGPDEVIAFFGALMQTGITVDNISFGTMGDGTVVEKHTGHGKLTNGEEIIFPTCSHYTIKDGGFPKAQVYTGDQHGVDRYFWAMYDLKPIPGRLDTHDPAEHAPSQRPAPNRQGVGHA